MNARINHISRFCSIGLCFILFMTTGSVIASDSSNTRLDTELDAIVNAPAYPLASLSVLAVRQGKIVYQDRKSVV